MKKSKLADSLGLVLSTLICMAILIFLTEGAQAKSNVVAVEGIKYNINSSMTDNLRTLISKKVCVTLDSGKTFAGVVKEVGNHLIHLEKLDGKEYFDALIRIENISGIDTMFRKIQR